MKRKQVTVHVDPELYKKFRMLLVDRETSFSDEVNNFMQKEVDSNVQS